MRLEQISATPHPAGNRIDLAWENPQPDQYPGVRVMRRQKTHPISPDDGVVVAEGEHLLAAIDENLKGETVYYYTLFPYRGDPPVYHLDRHNRTSAMAAAPYNLAEQMYDLLPQIYHRYDTILPRPEDVSEVDVHRGQLRRFLNLPGFQLDQLYSFARAMLDLYNLEKVDGRLLPLLAQWIGWDPNYRLEIDAQRHDIRNAPSIYQRVGIIPTVEATVKRTLGWDSRVKEFAHNVFLSNQPERLNLWAQQRGSDRAWSEPTEPLSLDFAYEGRPAAVEANGALWLFYHTLRKGQWDIWYKTFTLEEQAEYSDVLRWAASQPLTNRQGLDKHPTAVVQGDTLWVFWESYDETDQRWRINYCTRTDGTWSAIATFADAATDRRQPWAVADTNGLWLFWLERGADAETGWQLSYNRHNGTGWVLASDGRFPADAGEEPRVEREPFVLFHPVESQLWVFWARKAPNGGRWQVAYRVKLGLDPSVSDWDTIRLLPTDPPDADYDDREPTAVVDAAGDIELFRSSNRDGSWSIWRNVLNPATDNWGTAEEVTHTPYSQRNPLAVTLGESTLLVYRCNASVSYRSTVYTATETVDFRYAGSTTVDTRNAAKIALRGQFEDFQTYTYDTGQNGERTDLNWYARDTVGLYLTPDTEDQASTTRNRNLIKNVLQKFLPIQVRVVFIIEPAVYKESIYTYDLPRARPQRLITEQFLDRPVSPASEIYSGPRDSYRDTVPGWVWIHSWSEAFVDHHTVDVTTPPIDTTHRTWHTGIAETGE